MSHVNVVVTTDPEVSILLTYDRLGRSLASIISEAMSVSGENGDEITPRDVTVSFVDVSSRTVNPLPLMIEIFVFDHADRAANLDYRLSRITRELRSDISVPVSIIDGKGSLVRVQLSKGGSEEL